MLLCLIWWNRNKIEIVTEIQCETIFQIGNSEISPSITWPRRCRELATRWQYNVRIDNLHCKKRLARIFFEILKKDFKMCAPQFGNYWFLTSWGHQRFRRASSMLNLWRYASIYFFPAEPSDHEKSTKRVQSKRLKINYNCEEWIRASFETIDITKSLMLIDWVQFSNRS